MALLSTYIRHDVVSLERYDIFEMTSYEKAKCFKKISLESKMLHGMFKKAITAKAYPQSRGGMPSLSISYIAGNILRGKAQREFHQ